MHEQPAKGVGTVPPAADRIEDLARLLRDADHLGPAARVEIAGLLRALALELDRGGPTEHGDHLADSTAQLVRAVSDGHGRGMIEVARGRLDDAIARAEARAPAATDIVGRLADLLAGIGI